VTCIAPHILPRPVRADPLDAEVVEAEVVAAPARAMPRAGGLAPPDEPAPAFNPYADIDDDPYQLADPDPVATAPAEAKRPCPMCGEMILASAVKCRFCGEVFDPALKKGKSKKSRKSSGGGGSSAAGARDLGIGILCMAAGIGLTIASFANASDDGSGRGKFYVFYGLMIGGFIQMCRGFISLVRSD
jgi:hypothetical protein